MTCLLLLLMICPANATGATFEDYERAREALARGEILPLADILERVETEFDARMIELELMIEGDAHVYEFELVTRGGRVLEVQVDAATGDVLSVRDDD